LARVADVLEVHVGGHMGGKTTSAALLHLFKFRFLGFHLTTSVCNSFQLLVGVSAGHGVVILRSQDGHILRLEELVLKGFSGLDAPRELFLPLFDPLVVVVRWRRVRVLHRGSCLHIYAFGFSQS